jgi:PAS domain S-box-containing protein
MKTRFSIRLRATQLTAGFLLITILAYSVANFRAESRSALRSARVRLDDVTRQLLVMFGASAGQLRDQVRALSSDSLVRTFLSNPDAPARAAAVAHLRSQTGRTPELLNVEVWTPLGDRLAESTDSIPETGVDERRDLMARLAHGADVATGAIASVRNAPVYDVIARVSDGKRALGFLVMRRTLAASPRAVTQMRRLVGSNARLLIGNARGEIWSDFRTMVSGPPVDRATTRGLTQYERPGAGGVLTDIDAIPGTPWLLAVEFPMASLTSDARADLGRMSVFALLLVIVASATAWAMAGRVTRPIAEIARAAVDFSAGNYTRRIAVETRDEIGVLAGAFNHLAERVDESRRTLEANAVALSNSEMRYRMLFEGNPESMWVYDLETLAFVAVNDAAIRRYGYSREEFLAMTILEIRPAGDTNRLHRSLAHLGDGGGAAGEVWRHRAKSGEVFEVEVYSQPLNLDDRKTRLVLAHDITVRRRAEEALRESEERFRQLAEHTNEAFFVVDTATGTALYASPAWATIWGRSLEDAYDPTIWFTSIHPDDQPRLQASMQANLRGEPSEDIFRILRPDGSARWVRGRAYPVRDADGRIYRRVGVSEDITDLRKAEARYLQAQKMESVGRLAGGVAHDFNNLLTVILGECDAAAHAASRAEVGAALGEVRRAGERAALLTRQLLAYSRHQLITPEVFELNAVVGEVEKMLRRLIGEDVALVLRLKPDAGFVKADRGQIEQVLVNLAVNARDAMPTGGTLSIETRHEHIDEAFADERFPLAVGDYVVFSVSDTGVGIPDDVRARIFEPFFTTKEPGKGTGLGLATCLAIVHEFGGHIGVYSEQGLGTTLRVYLPRIAEDNTGPRPSTRPEASAGSEIVLLVEDEPAVRRLAARILVSQGYTVLQAGDGEEALQVLTDHNGRVDLLLTDVVLPKLGGRELADRVRAAHPSIKILFSSGYSDDVILRHRLFEHDAALLPKPYTPAMLSSRVREALDFAK